MTEAGKFTGHHLPRTGYEVRPGQNGSFVVTEGLGDTDCIRMMWAFTNCHDMVNFLNLVHRGNVPHPNYGSDAE